MKKYSNVFDEFATYESLYKGFLLARKGKRFKGSVLEYAENLGENLVKAQRSLVNKTYKVEHISEFIEYYPKKRIITVIPFENRVVNCAAYNALYPIYSKNFYEHSYGSIKGKGQVKAVNQLQYWLKLIQNKPQDWYLCKLDITKFFFRIPFEVQLRELGKPLNDPDMMWFLETAIRCDGRNFGLPLETTDVTQCERIAGIGMQVGSLISQLTANVVLSAADHYIKRELRVPYYIRYMDDMIFLAPSKAEAFEIKAEFERFLNDYLKLSLNSKTAIMPAYRQVEFVGRLVNADSIKIRKSSSLSMKRNLKRIAGMYNRGEAELDYCLNVIRSYIGIMSHCDCAALRSAMCDNFKLIKNGLSKSESDYWDRYFQNLGYDPCCFV